MSRNNKNDVIEEKTQNKGGVKLKPYFMLSIILFSVLFTGCDVGNEPHCDSNILTKTVNVTYINGFDNYTCDELHLFLYYNIQPVLISKGTQIHYRTIEYYNGEKCDTGEMFRSEYTSTQKTSKEAIFNYWIKNCHNKG